MTLLESSDASGTWSHWEYRVLNNQFIDRISFQLGRYEVHLPWRNIHPEVARQLWDQLQMPDESVEPPEMTTTSISRIRCRDRRLDRKEAYGESQWTNLWWSRKGSLPASSCCHKKRQRQQNSELSVIRPISQTESPWLYTGQVLSQKIIDIFLRFRTHRKALAGDIKKAFLNKSVSEEDRDVLRFLWFDDLKKEYPQVIVLQFARVVVGVSSSPFLRNATVKHH